jgi:hypothetical protein
MLKRTIALIGILAIFGVGSATTNAAVASDRSNITVANEGTAGLTSGQRNAIESARSYLSFTAFSKSGLIDQLKFEGYSTRNATFAVNYIKVSWKKQAFKSAKAYLRFTSFSLSGLIDQLVFEGFTRAQAIYGANRAL